MLETAMLKVWSTERLWQIVNDAFQIHGGAAYFTDRPLERMLRDHRINQIGEGANEVLTSFIALVGMRAPGLRMKEVADSLKSPLSAPATIGKFLADAVKLRFNVSEVPVRTDELKPAARRLGKGIRTLATTVQAVLMAHREKVLEHQLVQERIAWMAMELFAAACALSRWDDERQRGNRSHDAVARLFVADALRHVETSARDLQSNDDKLLLAAARAI
jgi:alkylation response protein AidB-like acyl-CoA dehydrogenase